MNTKHTDSVEAARKKYIEMWGKGEFEWNHHDGGKLGQKPISPERIWQVFIKPTLQATQSQQVEEAVRKALKDFQQNVDTETYEWDKGESYIQRLFTPNHRAHLVPVGPLAVHRC